MAFSAADACSLLRRAHAQDRLSHAYLVTGPEGSGKRALVREMSALILGCTGDPFAHPDAHVLEPESKSRRIKIDPVRDLERELQMRSLRGGRKIAVIFDADRLVDQAANAFLKTLEEPPAQSHIFLVSALPDQLLETILSRCIEVPLHAGTRRALTALEAELLGLLREFSAQPRAELPQVFLLVRRFQELLAQAKGTIQEENEKALKKEEPLYKQVGNTVGLEEREEYFKALTESGYIGERSRLLSILEQWWGDALRQQAFAGESASPPPTLDHVEYASDTAALAARWTAAELLRKAAALEDLRENLGRNIQEQLAIEVAFLKTFGT